MTKRYDQAYFDRWYRDPGRRVWGVADVERKVRLVLGIAEFLLDRRVRSVLDVGCGEGTWQPILKRLRPAARYQGVDGSAYVVRRFGRRRHIRLGTLGCLADLGLDGPLDVVVCCDVLHYVETAELRRGLREISGLVRGVAYLEAYTSADDVSGDESDFQRRAPAEWRRLFRAAGFIPVGMQCYVGPAMQGVPVALEKPKPTGA
ncbi:MAG: class I SAM-dependent DNA methyltransferase [Gemmatimonadales bacterium]